MSESRVFLLHDLGPFAIRRSCRCLPKSFARRSAHLGGIAGGQRRVREIDADEVQRCEHRIILCNRLETRNANGMARVRRFSELCLRRE